jgi:hypothetical protein
MGSAACTDGLILELEAAERIFVSPHAGILWVYNRVRKTWTRQNQHISNKGYPRSSVRVDGDRVVKIAWHRAVYVSVNGPTELVIDHKNGRKKDPRLDNLEAVTHGENTQRYHRKRRSKLDGEEEAPF